MPIYSFADAKNSLAARLGHRNDLADAQLGKWIDQSQYVLATNVRGLEVFDQISSPKSLLTGQTDYLFGANFSLTDVFGINWVKNVNSKILLRRGELEVYMSYVTIPSGTPTMWARSGSHFYIFQAPTHGELIQFYYRALPTPGVLEAPDDWFDNLVGLAVYYALAEIGKADAKDTVARKLPVELQLAITNPMTPQKWDASVDPNLAVYSSYSWR